MKLIDNVTHTLKEDFVAEIKEGGKLSIAASCFSIYAFQELKSQLKDIDNVRFIFTSPTFVTEKATKQQREFYIPRLNRERNLLGTEFEVRLRNELSQKAIARECAEWIRKKACFKSNRTNENMMGFVNVDNTTYMPVNGFTTVDLGCERGNNAYTMISRLDYPESSSFLTLFDQLWNDSKRMQVVTEEVLDNITNAYKENAPDFLYFVTLYNIFNEFWEDISEDVLPNEATGFKSSLIWNKLYNFQKDATLAIINKLEKYNGCILADSVGLGKTFTALAVIKYYENRNKSVLVLCPKKLNDNWMTYRSNYLNNPIAKDRLRYDVFFHSDLSRRGGYSNGYDLNHINWGNYDLVVIDESHNFRNGGKITSDDDDNPRENRYLKLMNTVIRAGVKTKVLMLSATPVNNRFNDLKNQIQLAYEGESEKMDALLDTNTSIEQIFKQAQAAYNHWAKMSPAERTTKRLLEMLSFDFFELLDSVTIARSRKHVERYYDTTEIGKFPTRLTPLSRRPSLTDLDSAINYNEIFDLIQKLNLAVYTPSDFILPSAAMKYLEVDEDGEKSNRLSIHSREMGIRRLMSINLLKRLESSVNSFRLSLRHVKELVRNTIETIDHYDKNKATYVEDFDADYQYDLDSEDTDIFIGNKKNKILLEDLDYISWKGYLKQDLETLDLLIMMLEDITPEHDAKLQQLVEDLRHKFANPINNDNKKVIIFTAFAGTAEYLYKELAPRIKDNHGLNVALVTATGDDNPISVEEKGDLEYRRAQLKKLQEEVVDIEDMNTGVSIMDLGLNEFRLDLLEYMKQEPDIEHTPFGLHAVVPAAKDTPPGVVFVLKNRSEGVNIDHKNRLHPFYLVYVKNDGQIEINHLSPKELLDKMRFLCKNRSEPDKELCKAFNKETKDGTDMRKYSKLLSDAIASIVNVKEKSDLDCFLSGVQSELFSKEVQGLDDFELICFLVIRDHV